MRRSDLHRSMSFGPEAEAQKAVGDLALKTALMTFHAPFSEVAKENLPKLAKLLGASGVYLLERYGEVWRFRCLQGWPETLTFELSLGSNTLLSKEGLTDLRRGKSLFYERDPADDTFPETGFNALPFQSLVTVGLNTAERLVGMLVVGFPDRGAQPKGLSNLLSLYAQAIAPLLELRESTGNLDFLSKALDAGGTMAFIAEAAMGAGDDPRIVYTNEAFIRETGFPPEDVVGETIRLLHGPKTDPDTVALICKAIAAGKPVQVDILCYRRDGSEFWAELECQPLRYRGGAPSYWVGIGRDISKRKAEELRLKRSEARYRGLVQHGLAVVYIVDREGRIRYVSDSLGRELGYESSAVLGKSAFSFIHPEDAEGAEALFAHALDDPGAVTRGEFRLSHSDGGWRWMAASVRNMFDKPEIGGLVMDVRDVGGQRDAADRLASQQHDLGRAAFVRQSLLEIVNDLLQRGIDEVFYQRLLERAIAAIPNAQAGSILLKDDEEHYVMTAVVGFDLTALQEVRFTHEQLSHTADLESYSPRLVTQLASLNAEMLEDHAAEVLEQAGRTREIAVSLSVPVMVGDTFEALLSVDNFESEAAFGVEAIETAALFASQVGLALQRLKLQQEAELRARFRQVLTEVSNDALSDGVDEGFYQRLVKAAVETIPDADAGSVLVRQSDGRFRFVAAVGFDLAELGEMWLEPNELYITQQAPDASSFRYDELNHHVGKVLDEGRLGIIEQAGRVAEIRAALAVPVRLDGELVALLSLDNMRSSQAFQGDSREMAEAFGTQIRAVLQRLQHEQQAERRAEFHQQLSAVVGETLEEGLDAGFYRRLLERAIATVPGAEAGSILLRDPEGDFCYVAAQGYDLTGLQHVSYAASEVQRWHPHHDPVLVDFAEMRSEVQDGRAEILNEVGRLGDIKVSLAVPLALQGEIQAILNLESFSSRLAFSEEALEYAASFATQIGVVLQRLKLQQEAERRAKFQHTLARVERLLLEFASLDTFFKPLADIILGTPEIGAEQIGVYRLKPDGTLRGELFGMPPEQAEATREAWQAHNMLDLEHGEGLLAQVARQGEPHYAPDVSKDPGWVELGVTDIKSILLLPVFRQDRLWGIFDLVSSKRDAFSQPARELLTQVTRGIELALDKQASREELQREYERLKIVSAAHARLLGSRSLGEVYACAVEALIRETPATSANLLLYRPHSDTLKVVAGAGQARGHKNAVLRRDGGVAWQVFETRRTISIPDSGGAHPSTTELYHAGESFTADFLGSPLQDDSGQVVGVLVALIEGEGSFSPSDQSFVEAIAQACTSALIRLHLVERSEKEAGAYRSLAQFGATIEEINEADRLIDMGLHQLKEQLGFDCAHYHRLRGGMLEIVTVAGYEADELLELWKKQPLPLGEGLVGRSALSGEFGYVPDYRAWEHKVSLMASHEVSTALAIPVRRGDQVVSVVGLHSVGVAHPLREEQISIARNFVKRLEHALERADNLREVGATREATFRSLGVMLEYRDFETKGHTDRVVELALQLGRKLDFDRDQLRALRWGAYLHDIGKIAIPDQILLKPGKLEPHEFDIIRRHTVIGTEMCRNIPFLPTETRQVVRSHHERWDGGGYPDALMGNEVPLMARIFALIDVYDALTSTRPYKEAWSKDDAVAEILAQAGRQFDPELVPVFIELVMQRRES